MAQPKACDKNILGYKLSSDLGGEAVGGRWYGWSRIMNVSGFYHIQQLMVVSLPVDVVLNLKIRYGMQTYQCQGLMQKILGHHSSSETWISGISIDIREARSDATDVKSEVSNDEMSEVLRQCIPRIIVGGLHGSVPQVLGA